MAVSATEQNAAQSNSPTPEQTEVPITPELVRQVTEKVYALWRRDLQLERERLGSRRSQVLSGGAR